MVVRKHNCSKLTILLIIGNILSSCCTFPDYITLNVHPRAFFNVSLLIWSDSVLQSHYLAGLRAYTSLFEYNSDASRIWSGDNSSAEIIYRFLCFEGCGIKIASMATNLLHRIFGITYTDYSALDISPDIHIKRVLYRIGLIENMEDTNLVIYRAKSISPEYPGILDECCWDMGRLCCHPTDPECDRCKFWEICLTCQGVITSDID